MAAPSAFDDDVPRDDEGLLLKYDVVICGTGLCQSILASALSRAGKSVVHCDKQDFYGELETVWTLPYLERLGEHDKMVSSSEMPPGSIVLDPEGCLKSLKLHSMKRSTDFQLYDGCTVSTPYGPGKLKTLNIQAKEDSDFLSLEIVLETWTLANGKSPSVHIGLPKTLFYMENTESLEHFLETNYRVVLCETETARMLLEQKSRSFALDMSPGLIYSSGKAVQGLLKSGVADYLEFKAIEGLLWLDKEKLEKVPCSKNDVFASSLLSPMDKRRLMKFLHLALDYGTAAEDSVIEDDVNESVQSLNERHLNQGRSLARPQNKAVQTDEMSDLKQCIEEKMNFQTFLIDKQRLSPKLTTLVRYALALEHGQEEWTVLEGMESLCQHMLALGRYGKTAFLAPMYGSGELSQAFCRSAAVYGATYLLRRAPVGIKSDGEKVTGVIVKAEEDGSQKSIAADNVILPEDLVASSSGQRILRRIGIFMGKFVSNDHGEQRHIVIIPPYSFGNKYAIHGLLLDETLSISPMIPGGCSVVHLTTMIDGESDDTILDIAMSKIAASSASRQVREIFEATLSYDLPDSGPIPEMPNGVHAISRTEPALTLDEAFERVAPIFSRICPDEDFLALAKVVDDAVKERIGESRNEIDDEQLVLDSAVGMLNQLDPAESPQYNDS